MKLREVCEFSRLVPNNIETLTHNNHNFGQYGDTLIGIEVEVENNNNTGEVKHSWRIERDGSLRNNGLEFISKPLKPTQIETAIEHLYTNVIDKDAHFSPRTSLHVHMNCRELTFMQIYNIVLLYQCFEDLMYDYAGVERKKSIFCVPVGNTNYYINFRRHFGSGSMVGWSKYTGLNLGQLNNYGTIEFRHLRGTRDKQVIYQWLHFLFNLYNFAKSHTTEQLEAMIIEYSNNHNFQEFGERVFGYNFRTLSANSNYNKKMQEDVAISKLFMGKLQTQGLF
jgi:hypothetical protein